jgi:hypothetical protein
MRGEDGPCAAWVPHRHEVFCRHLAEGRSEWAPAIRRLSLEVATLTPVPPGPATLSPCGGAAVTLPIPPPRPSGRWPGGPSYQAPPGDGRLAVVIPTRDRPRLVGRAITSALGQTRPPARVIVVLNGGATAEMYAAVLDWFRQDPRVEVLHRGDLSGFAAPINAGLERVGTEYAAVLDDDDEWDPGFAAALCGVLDADRSLGLAYCATRHPAEPGQADSLFLHPPTTLSATFEDALRVRNWFGWSQAAFRAKLLQDDPVAPEAGASADWDAWLRIAARAGAYHVADPLADHWWHGANASRDPAWMGRGQDWVRAGIAAGRYGHQDAPGRDAAERLVRSLTDLQRAAVESCGHRHEVESCCGPVTYCDLGRIESSATATADCARCVVADLPR